MILAHPINNLITIVIVSSSHHPLEFQCGIVSERHRRLIEYFTQIEPYRATVLSFKLLLARERTAAGVPVIYIPDTYLTGRWIGTCRTTKEITYACQSIDTDLATIPSIVLPTTKRRPGSEALWGGREGGCRRRLIQITHANCPRVQTNCWRKETRFRS